MAIGRRREVLGRKGGGRGGAEGRARGSGTDRVRGREDRAEDGIEEEGN